MPGHVTCLFKVTSPVVAEDEELNQLQARSCLCGTYVRQLTTQLSYTYVYIYISTYTSIFVSAPQQALLVADVGYSCIRAAYIDSV